MDVDPLELVCNCYELSGGDAIEMSWSEWPLRPAM